MIDLSNLELRPNFKIVSGGYPREETGVIGQSQAWRPAGDHGELLFEYYFRDSESSDNNNSSRVVMKLKTQFQAIPKDGNIIEIQCFINLIEIRRDDIRGNPGAGRRRMFLTGRTPYRNSVFVENSSVNQSQVLWSGETNVASGMERLSPSATGSQQFGVDIRSNVVGHNDTPIPSPFVDQMWFGVEFRNVYSIPKNYRPGKIFNKTDGNWYSCNRTGGASNIRIDGRATMGLLNDPPAGDNSPSIYNRAWGTMKKIGLRQDD